MPWFFIRSMWDGLRQHKTYSRVLEHNQSELMEKPSEKILRMPAMRTRLGLSRSTLYNKINSASRWYDPTFPKPIRLGPAAIGWLESEIEHWIKNCREVSHAP